MHGAPGDRRPYLAAGDLDRQVDLARSLALGERQLEMRDEGDHQVLLLEGEPWAKIYRRGLRLWVSDRDPVLLEVLMRFYARNLG